MTTSLWIPGQGFVPSHIRSSMQAVSEYDADLSLARDENAGGQWVILLKSGPEGRPFPVLGLGYELPAPEAIKKKLYMSDTRRRGREIVADIQRNNDSIQARSREKLSEAGSEVAEVIEWALRKKGQIPDSKIFVPSGKDV